ncbi:MAG: (2Fe-2S)-binding protein [Myxococcaceae bacterium]|nr:(2Fe-2S)-binding protein [Myxococcaceae bacterium]
MIVCVCHGIPCKKIRSVIREGAESVDAVGEACGAGTDCGACRDAIEDLIEETAPSRRGQLPLLMTG